MSEGNQSATDRSADRVGPVCGAELAADRRDVKLHGLIADVKLCRNGFVRQSFGEELEDFDLACGQRLDEPLAARVVGR